MRSRQLDVVASLDVFVEILVFRFGKARYAGTAQGAADTVVRQVLEA